MSTEKNEMNTDISIEKRSRLDRVKERIAELEHVRKQLQAKENVKARKERTRRLIQIGAISLQYLQLSDTIEPAEFEQVIRKKLGIIEQDKEGKV